jgi:hypothetical protein
VAPEYHEIIRERAMIRMQGEKNVEDYEVKINDYPVLFLKVLS